MSSTENFDPGRICSATDRVFGIQIQLAQGDPLAAQLSTDWQTTRWYASETERDKALKALKQEHRFSRQGDRPTLTYQRVEEEKPNSPVISPRQP